MRALYGLIGSLAIAVTISFLTKSKKDPAKEGLVVGSLDRAKRHYKGAPPNEKEGRSCTGKLVVDNAVDELGVSKIMADRMAAETGDIVYISDARRWLGGLRSVHAKISLIHDGEENTILISLALIKQGNFLIHKKHRIEKII